MDENNRNKEQLISDETARELLRSFKPRTTEQRNSEASQSDFRRKFPDMPEKMIRSDYQSESEPISPRSNVGGRFNQRSHASSEQPNEVDSLPVRNYNIESNKPENVYDINRSVRNQNQRITDAIIIEDTGNNEETHIDSELENTDKVTSSKKNTFVKIFAMVFLLALFSLFLSSGNIMNLTEVSLSSNDRDSFFQSSTNNLLSEAMKGTHTIPRTYTLGMGEYLTPKPDKTKFTKIEDEERKNYDGSPIDYYKDETIEVKCWKEKTKYGIMTFAEVWIAHPSQFRRTIVDNVISDKHLDHPQNIFAKTNGVLGMSGDYCAYRPYGIEILYGNLVRDKVGSHLTPKMDILVYDTDGNFSVYESTKKFFQTDVYKNEKIIHTLAFGPMLIDDYKVSTKKDKLYKYQNGRPWEKWPRAAICQFDYDKHYLLCRLGQPGTVMEDFAKEISKKGVRLAYALDGGQTGTIMFNKKIVNEPAYGGTRAISDIIYFATAVPDE